MAEPRGQDVAVGAMFALALVVLALGIMAVGEESRLFSSKAQYLVLFPNADGLRVGSPVKMAGVQIGTVTSISLPTAPTEHGIEVVLGIDRAYVPRIREDSAAGMRILLYLSGEKYVEVSAGSPQAELLPEGSRIPLMEQNELFAQGEAIAENLTDITVSLKNILEKLEEGEGVLGQMLTDPEFGKEGLASLRSTLDNLALVTGDLTRGRAPGYSGEGVAGRLIYDEELAARLDRLAVAIDGFAELAAALERREGALGALLVEDGEAERALADLAAATGSLRRTAERVEQAEGLLGRLLYDADYSEKVARDLESTLGSLAAITGKIERGEGTLGALLHDPTLYEGAEEVVAGVNDSKFARWLLRYLRKKGIKAEDEEREAADEASGEEP